MVYLQGLFLWSILLGLYMLPTLIAHSRTKKGFKINVMQVGIVNLFFGLTIIGWIVALIWSFGGEKKAG